MNTSGNGQVHHPFSKKVVRAAEKNPNLQGHVTGYIEEVQFYAK